MLILPGEHNLNILVQYYAILAGVPVKAIVDSLTTFSGIDIDFNTLVQIVRINTTMIPKQLIL